MASYGTKYPELFAALTREFNSRQIKTRTVRDGQKQREISYITARSIMNRLDAVLGPENWTNSYSPATSGVLCTLTITLPDGEKVSKSDVGPHGDDRNGDKSAFSGAFKRAAVMFGIGRHLYGEGMHRYVDEQSTKQPAPPTATTKPSPNKTAPADFTDGKLPPGSSQWGAGSNGTARKAEPQNGTATAMLELDEPRNAAELIRFVRSIDPTRTTGPYLHLKQWGHSVGHPADVRAWTDEQAIRGYIEVRNYLDDRAGGD